MNDETIKKLDETNNSNSDNIQAIIVKPKKKRGRKPKPKPLVPEIKIKKKRGRKPKRKNLKIYYQKFIRNVVENQNLNYQEAIYLK